MPNNNKNKNIINMGFIFLLYVSNLREDVSQAFVDYEEKHKLLSEQVQNAISQLRDELDIVKIRVDYNNCEMMLGDRKPWVKEDDQCCPRS